MAWCAAADAIEKLQDVVNVDIADAAEPPLHPAANDHATERVGRQIEYGRATNTRNVAELRSRELGHRRALNGIGGAVPSVLKFEAAIADRNIRWNDRGLFFEHSGDQQPVPRLAGFRCRRVKRIYAAFEEISRDIRRKTDDTNVLDICTSCAIDWRGRVVDPRDRCRLAALLRVLLLRDKQLSVTEILKDVATGDTVGDSSKVHEKERSAMRSIEEFLKSRLEEHRPDGSRKIRNRGIERHRLF
jgi:hypothetical protein